MRKIAFQGESGAFSEEAALKLLGSVELLPCVSFDSMFEAVKSGECDGCIAPIENSLAGSVHANYDLLLQHDFYIIGEIFLRIVHNLIALPGVSFEQVRKVYSHPVALAQCRKFCREFRHLEQVSEYDTAGSVKMLRDQGLRDGAAIASIRAATVYGASVLRTEIEDNKENYTRFLLLSRDAKPQPSANKTSIVFSTRNEPGMLFRCLAAFALRDIDLTKLESRPLHGKPWEYFFYVDFIGNVEDPNCKNALRHLEEMTTFLRILGSYPSAETR